MDSIATIKDRITSGLDCGPLSGGLRDAAAESLVRGIEELAGIFDAPTLESLAAVLAGVRTLVALTPEEMGWLHAAVSSENRAPFPCYSLADEEDVLSELQLGDEVPDLYLWLWFPMASGEGGSFETRLRFFTQAAQLAEAAQSQAGPGDAARRMASALLGPAAWLLRPEADGRATLGELEAACRGWLRVAGTDDAAGALEGFCGTLQGVAAPYVLRARTYRRVAEAWMAVRHAAKSHAAADDWLGAGYPSREARRFREAWADWEGLMGSRSEAAFLGMLLRPIFAHTGGHAYLAWPDPPEDGVPCSVTLLISPHEGFSLCRTLSGMDYTLRRILAHELGHVVWRLVLDDNHRQAYTGAWEDAAEADCLPSEYAGWNAEEGFSEHVSARLGQSWGDGYVSRRREEISSARCDTRTRTLAMSSLDRLVAFGGRPARRMEDAAGCFR